MLIAFTTSPFRHPAMLQPVFKTREETIHLQSPPLSQMDHTLRRTGRLHNRKSRQTVEVGERGHEHLTVCTELVIQPALMHMECKPRRRRNKRLPVHRIIPVGHGTCSWRVGGLGRRSHRHISNHVRHVIKVAFDRTPPLHAQRFNVQDTSGLDLSNLHLPFMHSSLCCFLRRRYHVCFLALPLFTETFNMAHFLWIPCQ